MEEQYYIFLTILIVASLSDIIVPIFLGSKYPDYNHLYDSISTLSTRISPVTKWAGLNLILTGLLFNIFSVGQQLEFSNSGWISNLYSIGIFFFGTGCILAGIFPEDPKGSNETGSGKIHGISSGIGFIFLILCPFWAIFIGEFNGNYIINIILLSLGILTFILFLLSKNKDNGILKYTGLLQRLNLIFLYICLIINYISLMKVNN